MSLTNLSFLGVYFPLLIIAYYNPFFKGNTFKKILLLGASLVLYTFAQPEYILLLVGVILMNYCLVRVSFTRKKHFYKVLAIILDAGVLLLFKYGNAILAFFNIDNNNLIFPIGLSFFTFKAISYVVDSKEDDNGNLIDAAIYISNFLTIVSGPLSFYEKELPCIAKKQETKTENMANGLKRMIVGYGKKIIIADSLNTLVSTCFFLENPSVFLSWAGAIAYALQLYFDFAGYSDMAIGIGMLFGFSLPENFNDPYMATSISDFWKRWHMSLTKWFTKYIYIPLGGSRVKTVLRHIFNLLVVWLLTGIWHGSHATFIVWALIYFGLQLLEKYTKIADFLNRIHLGRIYTLSVVLIEWVIFRADSLSHAFNYLKSMFFINSTLIHTSELQLVGRYLVPLILGIIFSTDISKKIETLKDKNRIINVLYNLVYIVLFVVCILISISKGYSMPLYAGF